MTNNTLKRVTKKFSDFPQEEHWLQSMLTEGWILKSYDIEDVDDCEYVFERITNESQKNLIYKIDYRFFNKKEKFEEYKELFEDCGWTILSKNKWYSKHIFYTTSTNALRDIFSDQKSYQERERRKMFSSLISIIVSSLIFVVSIILYMIFERTSIIGAGLITLIFNTKFIVDYFRYRKRVHTMSKSNQWKDSMSEMNVEKATISESNADNDIINESNKEDRKLKIGYHSIILIFALCFIIAGFNGIDRYIIYLISGTIFAASSIHGLYKNIKLK